MKNLLILFLLGFGLNAQAQTPKVTLDYRADTIRFWKNGGNAEFKLQNSTKNVVGTLTNVGNGVTKFIKPKIYNDSMLIVGLDTLALPAGGGGGPGGEYTEGEGIDITAATINSTYPVFTTAAAIRAITATPGRIYRANLFNIPSDFLPDYADNTSPDDGVMILIANGVRFKRVVLDRINAKWFGATGNGTTDDWAALQAASDWCIAHMEYTRTLYLPRGNYKITQPWTFYKWNGVNYEFFSINVEGERVGNFTRTDYSTVIKPTFSDRNAVEFQLAKTSRFSGIYLSGPADGIFTWDQKTFVGIPFSSFMQSLSRDTRHGAQAAISIDPYTQSAASRPSDSYPGRNAWYRGPGGTGGSSDVTIEDVRMYGFTIGVGISLNGITRNAEVIKVLHSSIGYAKVAVASGQDQTKNNIVRDLICWDYVHTVFDNTTYGEGVGTSPMIDGVNIAGRVNRLANVIDAGRYGIYMQRIFAEGIFQIGTIISQAPSSLMDSQFDFATSEGSNIPSPDNYMQAENLSVSSVQFRIYDNSNKRIHFLANNNVVFRSCTFQNMPIVKNYNQAGNVTPTSFYNCNLNIAGGTVGTRMLNVQRGTGEKNTVLGFPLTIKSGTNVSFGELNAEYNDPNSESLIDLEQTVAVTVNTANATASLTLAFPGGFATRIGDYLRSENEVLGRVETNNGTTITLSQVPIGLETGNYPIYLSYVRKVQTPFTGNVTSGSLVITNVETFAGYPEVGDRIENHLFGIYRAFSGTDAAVGTYITAVDPGNKTVTVNFGPSSTATYVDFAMGDPTYSIQNRTTPDLKAPENMPNVFFKGTRWVLKGTGAIADRVFKFTRSGYLNAAGVSGSHQALWEEIVDGGASPWTLLTADDVQFLGSTGHVSARITADDPGKVSFLQVNSGSGVSARFQTNLDLAFAGTLTEHPFVLYANVLEGLRINIDGEVLLASLAHTGVTEMVTVGVDGKLGRQAIPAGGGGGNPDTSLAAIGFGLVYTNNVLEVDPAILYAFGSLKMVADLNYTIQSTDRHLLLPATTTTRNIILPDPTTTSLREVVLECRANTSTAWKVIGTYIAAGTITTGTTFSTVTDQFISSNETLHFVRTTMLTGTQMWMVSNQ